MKRFFTLMNTTAARLSALYLVLFSVCAVVLVLYMTSVAARFVVNETRSAISEEIEQLNGAYTRGGVRRLVIELDRRSRAPGANLYLVADQTGRILSGNVLAIQPGVLENEGWTTRPFTYARYGDDQALVEDHEKAPRAIAQVISIQNGMRVLVGRDLGEPQKFRDVVRRALTIALLIMGFGGLLIWFFVGRRALARIDRMSAASARIMQGDLSGRLPVTAANDEFDRMSSSLNAMLARIETLNDGLREVSDSIAHDLKTPLTRLRNRAEAALTSRADGDDPAPLRAAITDMMDEADNLIKIFNALLLISRVEAGYSKAQMAEVSLTDIATDLQDLYEPLAEEAGASLTLADSDAVTVSGNRELIGQAITNVLDNALKYAAGEGGATVITMRVKRSADGRFGSIEISDNGPGIAEEDRERVLERFVRLDTSRSRPGSGLGLSLVGAIMHLHAGTIELSDANPGLLVTLSFPYKS